MASLLELTWENLYASTDILDWQRNLNLQSTMPERVKSFILLSLAQLWWILTTHCSCHHCLRLIFLVLQGNPFLKLQHQAAEPKTVVVKPVVRQQEPPPPPPPPQEAPQPLLKPACLPRLPDTSNQAQSRLQQLLTTVPAQRLNRQISLDTAQKRTSPPVRRVERHSSVGSMVNEKSRLFSPVRPLMEIKTLPVLPVHSLARTVDKASPDIQPIQLVARTVTESTNHIAMSTVQAGNQTAINVVAMVFGPCFW